MPYYLEKEPYLPDRIRHGYYETKCDACQQYFCRKIDSMNYIEKYLDLMCCPCCGYGNRVHKERVEDNSADGYQPHVEEIKPVTYDEKEYSMGFEIEFFIPDPVKDVEYISRVRNPKYDTLGFDGATPFIKEFRSFPCYSDDIRTLFAKVSRELDETVHVIEECGGKLAPYKISLSGLLTFGIHLSFGGDLLAGTYGDYIPEDTILGGILAQLKKKTPFRIERYFVDKFRYHRDRVEFRGFSSSENSIKIITDFLKNPYL
jgi:hypothetical protein